MPEIKDRATETPHGGRERTREDHGPRVREPDDHPRGRQTFLSILQADEAAESHAPLAESRYEQSKDELIINGTVDGSFNDQAGYTLDDASQTPIAGVTHAKTQYAAICTVSIHKNICLIVGKLRCHAFLRRY